MRALTVMSLPALSVRLKSEFQFTAASTEMSPGPTVKFAVSRRTEPPVRLPTIVAVLTLPGLSGANEMVKLPGSSSRVPAVPSSARVSVSAP